MTTGAFVQANPRVWYPASLIVTAIREPDKSAILIALFRARNLRHLKATNTPINSTATKPSSSIVTVRLILAL